MQKIKHYAVLDGMRGIAAICVMLGHFTGAGLRLEPNAGMAVDLFFMLSGFVIAHSYGEKLRFGMPAWDYLWRRLIRLYPMFIAGLVLGCVSFSVIGHPFWVAAAINSTFLPYFNNWETHNFLSDKATFAEIFPLNPPAWSLFFEMIASVWFLVFNRVPLKYLGIIVAILFIAYAGYCYSSFLPHGAGFYFEAGWGSQNFMGGFLRVFFGFIYGILLYGLRDIPVKKIPPTLIYILLLVIFEIPKQFRGGYSIVILTIVAPYLLLAGAKWNGGGKISKFLGDISYPLYCMHFPIGRMVFQIMGNSSPTLNALVSVAASLAVSYALLRLYDEPVRKLLSRAQQRHG